jgi:DNA-binding NarL/FixJ family response regulator
VLAQPALDALAGKTHAFSPKKSVVPEWFYFLTEKERSILLLISQGQSNDEIADRLNLGKNTIRNYVSSIYEKIDAKDRFHAMRIAIEAQIHTLVME